MRLLTVLSIVILLCSTPTNSRAQAASSPEIWAGSANGTVVYSAPQPLGCIPNVVTTSKTWSTPNVQLQVNGSLLTPGSFTATLTGTTINSPTPGVQVTCYDSLGNITGSFVVLAHAGGSETDTITISGTSDGHSVTANFVNTVNGRFGTITGTIQTTVPPQLVSNIADTSHPDPNNPATTATSTGTATLTLQQGVVAVINGTPNTATIVMAPSVITSTASPYPVGAQIEPITIECQDQSGNTVPNCMIDFDFDVIEGSGGHLHNTNRPTGDFGSHQCNESFPQHISCDTGTLGVAILAYLAPEASGTTETANGTVSANGLSNSFSFTINVQYDGLILASGPGLTIVTASQMHGNNNGWVSAATNFSLQYAASLFDLNLTSLGYTQIPNIRITATSLPLGGLFDCYTTCQGGIEWQPPHVAHRFGNNADVGMSGLTPQHRKALAWAVHKAGFQTPVPGERPSDPTSNHWHLVGPY